MLLTHAHSDDAHTFNSAKMQIIIIIIIIITIIITIIIATVMIS